MSVFINQSIYLSRITEPRDGMWICGDNWQAEIGGHLMEQVSAKEKLKVQTYQTSFVTIKIGAITCQSKSWWCTALVIFQKFNARSNPKSSIKCTPCGWIKIKLHLSQEFIKSFEVLEIPFVQKWLNFSKLSKTEETKDSFRNCRVNNSIVKNQC